MAGLDGDQPAEASAEHEDGPQSQRAAGCIEGDADPAHDIAIDRPEFHAVGVGGQPGRQESNHTQCTDDPAVGAILSLAGADVRRTEQSRTGHRCSHDDQRSTCRIGEERIDATPAHDGETDVGEDHSC